MSKGGGGSKASTSTSKDSKGNFVSGFQPYPASGQFPIVPQQNYWGTDGSFNVPGTAAPLMASNILERFPQLASLFTPQTPQTQTTSAQPGMYGLPPTFGALNAPGVAPEKDKGRKQKQHGPNRDTAQV